MRVTVSICLMSFLAADLAAQDPYPVSLSRNSISPLLAEKPPELHPGYASAGDIWMLYDWRFDLLSNGAQQFLLKKYGYLESEVDGLDGLGRSGAIARAQTAPRAQAVSP